MIDSRLQRILPWMYEAENLSFLGDVREKCFLFFKVSFSSNNLKQTHVHGKRDVHDISDLVLQMVLTII